MRYQQLFKVMSLPRTPSLQQIQLSLYKILSSTIRPSQIFLGITWDYKVYLVFSAQYMGILLVFGGIAMQGMKVRFMVIPFRFTVRVQMQGMLQVI